MHRMLPRIALPVLAAAAAALGFAAPAQADTDMTVTTLGRDLCIGHQTVTVSAGSQPGTTGLFYQTPHADRLTDILDCKATETLRWRNEDTGETGVRTGTEDFVRLFRQPWERGSYVEFATGPGRISLELGTDLPHQVGRAEIVVP